MREEEAVEWAVRSLEFAFDCGATAATLIPTRGGNGAMEELAAAGAFSPPALRTLEAAFEHGIPLKKGRVFADLWDVEKLAGCQACRERRIARLRAMNLEQRILAAVACERVQGRSMKRAYDIAVVGSGFAGSLLAMIARRLGHSVVLIEKGTHPRVVIGESSTPLANLLFEELCVRYDLPMLKPLAKWGSWQRTHPEIACGLKRGFTFHHHVLDGAPSFDPERRDQLLVAASPHDEIADMHWYRADFDHFLMQEAQRLGVDYFDRVTLRSYEDEAGEIRLRGERDGAGMEFHARFVVDATGPRGFLHRALASCRKFRFPTIRRHKVSTVIFPAYAG